MNSTRISAIIACYKDAQAIPIMARRLLEVFKKIQVDYEIIFVNDGSPDHSQQVLEELAAQDPKIKVITHSRNFGSQNAFTSGLSRATGNACVLLDGDLQDPPELISEFYEKWKQGYDVVYGIRSKREMKPIFELAYKAFYRLFRRLSYVSVPLDAGDFSLLDRKVVQALSQLPERDRFIRGLRAWVGFKQTGIPYIRPERMFGHSTNSLWSNIRWAKKGIFSFSYFPLEMISIIAAAFSLLTVVVIFFQILYRLLHPEIPQGITTIIVVCLMLGSIQMLSIAFLAEYMTKIIEEVKQRPCYIVAKEIGFDS